MIGLILGVAIGAVALGKGPTAAVGWRIGETPEATALVELTTPAEASNSRSSAQADRLARDAVQPYSAQVAKGTGERLVPGDDVELVQRVWVSLLVATGR